MANNIDHCSPSTSSNGPSSTVTFNITENDRTQITGGISQRSVTDAHAKNAVILVVAQEKEDKVGVVNSLTRSRGRKSDPLTAAGVRVVKCTSPARVVVDTTPLRYIKGKTPTAIARQWISRNGLRRIVLGKDVIVVCVITWRDMDSRQKSPFSSLWWVDIFQLIFLDIKEAALIFVNTEGEDVPSATRKKIEGTVKKYGFLTENVVYFQDDMARRIIDESLGHHREATLKSFSVNEAFLSKRRFGPWDNERVILFGKTGSGKSTLAQMLTVGDLYPKNERFETSSGIRAQTLEIQAGTGRGWYVLDTPGFGAPGGGTTRAMEKIKKYVRKHEGTDEEQFSHYLYMFQKDKVDELEERLWKSFGDLFGEAIYRQSSVVVTNSDQEWVEDNIDYLKIVFKGCESFLSADFSTSDVDEAEESLTHRKQSLMTLEENLARSAKFQDLESSPSSHSSDSSIEIMKCIETLLKIALHGNYFQIFKRLRFQLGVGIQ